jgi:type VI secretion system secreted protein VgrG
MEQYGIFYFFEHAEQKHTLVLANAPTVHQPCPGQAKARCDFASGVTLEEDIITDWQMEQELRPGKYALADYNFETPSTRLAVNVSSTINVGGNGKYEVYDYHPGEYLKKAQGEQLAKLRMEEEEAPHVVASGSGTCRAFTPGYKFDLAGHSPQMDKSYVLTEVQHMASVGDSYSDFSSGGDAEESYSNHFTCIPFDVPFRPLRVTPRPTVQGPQTAIVVGRAGEEIFTDKMAGSRCSSTGTARANATRTARAGFASRIRGLARAGERSPFRAWVRRWLLIFWRATRISRLLPDAFTTPSRCHPTACLAGR